MHFRPEKPDHRSMIARRSIGSFALLVVLAGCNLDMGPDLTLTCFLDCPISVPYQIAPFTERILVGDTVTFYSYSCPAAALLCGADANVASTWSVAGIAAVVAPPPPTIFEMVPDAKVVVRGVSPGIAQVIGKSRSNSWVDTSDVIVADSSVITTIDMGHAPSLDTLRLGVSRFLFVSLKDAVGNVYHAWPSEWSVSDTTVLEIGGVLAPLGGLGHRMAIPKSPGTVEVRTRFRELTASVRLVVVP
jgi:hypothetical protein